MVCKQAPARNWSWESREFLREKLIGKTVRPPNAQPCPSPSPHWISDSQPRSDYFAQFLALVRNLQVRSVSCLSQSSIRAYPHIGSQVVLEQITTLGPLFYPPR